jgi:dynein heavy chain
MREDLDAKLALIFQTYGHELEMVMNLYERHKHAPPVSRNLPPVAGNITWARHLLRRIEYPMRIFKQHPAVLATKEAKKIVKTYNKVCSVIVRSFGFLCPSVGAVRRPAPRRNVLQRAPAAADADAAATTTAAAASTLRPPGCAGPRRL